LLRAAIPPAARRAAAGHTALPCAGGTSGTTPASARSHARGRRDRAAHRHCRTARRRHHRAALGSDLELLDGLPAIVAHEATPGHYAHSRALRHVADDIRRSLHSPAFIEGWAHYAEELLLEEGFRADDPRFGIGVALEALIRVTRLAVAIGIHTNAMTLIDATARFTTHAYLPRSAARHEALRATYDPTYGHYTLGKLVIRQARDAARAHWADAYTHRRFHNAVLALGAPPLGILHHVITDADPSETCPPSDTP
jgi:hypothetical protein